MQKASPAYRVGKTCIATNTRMEQPLLYDILSD
jgi:hypothetical protein